MKERYLVVIKWDSYETSEVLFDNYIEAVEYFNYYKNAGEVVYLTKIIKVADIR